MRWLFVLAVCLFPIVLPAADPVPIIFDTDMDTDCDDAGALAMLHTLADRGEVEILATPVSSKFPYSPGCVRAINRYFGRPDLPVGSPQGKGAPTNRGSRYARQIAERFKTANSPENSLISAVDVYRRVLTNAKPKSVVIVTVGYATNLADLLRSGPDRWSEKTGTELVRDRVKQWVCMGGRYPEHLDPRVFGNFKPDPAAIRYAVEHWPGAIIFSGDGERVLTGRTLKATPKDNPVRQVYELYFSGKKQPLRPSWDQIALLIAVRPDGELWEVLDRGSNHIFPNGTNRWVETPDRDHLLFSRAKDPEIYRDLIDELMAPMPSR